MTIGASCAVLLAAIAGIAALCGLKRGKARKTGWNIGIAGLCVLAAAAAGYLALTLLFVQSVP